jgi:hypothetical protein
MSRGAGGAYDVVNLYAAHGERIGDQETVAAPGNGFGAHDGERPLRS